MLFSLVSILCQQSINRGAVYLLEDFFIKIFILIESTLA
jgi:hypothetical protein